jgi:uncharacterized protein
MCGSESTILGVIIVVAFVYWVFCVVKYTYEPLYADITSDAIILLRNLYEENHVPNSHGLEHARKVMQHARNAIIDDFSRGRTKSDDEELAIEMAALLHDADDRKYFPKNKNYENARAILRELCPDIENLVVTMISYVSASSNGDAIPDETRDRPWLLYPRWADRLEAIGYIGIVRAWEYSEEKNRPLFLPDTPKARSEDELWGIATVDRYVNYQLSGGKSASMIDHYYDKLLHIAKFQTSNVYLASKAAQRLEPLIGVCLMYGQGLFNADILEFVRDESKNE